MRRCDRAFKEAKRTGLQVDYAYFNQLRRDIRNQLDSSKNNYYANRLQSASNMKAKWNLGISKAKLPSPLTCFRADKLNRHFTSVSANIPVLTPTYLSELLTHPVTQITSSSFEFNHVTPECVQAAINAASSKAVGVDGISVEMLKKLPPFCVNTIADLFNSSLTNATFPNTWKRALIVPLAKTKTSQL